MHFLMDAQVLSQPLRGLVSFQGCIAELMTPQMQC